FTRVRRLLFFNDTATTEIYTLSLHDALPILKARNRSDVCSRNRPNLTAHVRSEEHTSELQSHLNLVCRLLLEKKKQVAQHEREVAPQRYLTLRRGAEVQV